jgi:hypothetical protein
MVGRRILPRGLALGALLVLLAAAAPARAANSLTVMDPTLDMPTVVTLGVQLLITGDDNFNATVTVRYRVTGTSAWSTGMPLFRVHPEQLQSGAPPAQFAGSIFFLRPDTSYDIELHAVDPDGGDFTKTLTGKTLPVPGDPPSPHTVNVTDTASLQAALTAAQPGDVILVANGTYGVLTFPAGGVAGNPVVVRGASQDGVIVDGAGCASCNVIEYYNAGYVHLENLTIQNAQRALRVQTTGTTGNVFRRLHVKNVILGITTDDDANGYYVADNVLEGRLVWPLVYKTDQGAHANDDGINVHGSGNVIAYNRISGFGDAMKTEQNETRANDFYGNDVLWTYDNGIELDTSQGNVRAFYNRWTNNSAPTSFQPIFGGPAYLVRNLIVNVADEPFKLHALGGVSEPSGGLILHNTVVKAGSSIQLSTPDTTRNFAIEDNLFIGNPTDGYSVHWDTPTVDPSVTLDFDGYWPDGKFEFGYSNTGDDMTYASFAAVVAAGRLEQHGLLVGASNFASGLATPSDWTVLLPPPDCSLSPSSLAVDRGTTFPNLDDGFTGNAPDLGAIELGCAQPAYGPRPAGVDESNTTFGCGAVSSGGDAGEAGGGDAGASADAGATNDGGATGTGTGTGTADGGAGNGAAAGAGSGGGCGCRTAPTRSGLADITGAVLVLLGLGLRRRRAAAAGVVAS